MNNPTTGLMVLAATAILAATGAWSADSEAPGPDPWEGVDPNAPPGPAAQLLHVPGVGLVARVDKNLTRGADPMQIEPLVLDEQGRQTAGGTSPTRSASSSYNPESKEMTHTWDGPDGHVVKWSAPGKKK